MRLPVAVGKGLNRIIISDFGGGKGMGINWNNQVLPILRC